MVDLQAQYLEIEDEIQAGFSEVLKSARFIGGPRVDGFARSLEAYLGVKHVIPCANGTDALQIAMMALGLKPGDEVIVPAFTYVATAEVIALLGLTPILVDVELGTYNLDIQQIVRLITPRTKAIVPVHLFGQVCDMEPIMNVAHEFGLHVIEDNAQSLGAYYQGWGGKLFKSGTMGDFACTSFFPSKNLGCYGDGGAIMTNSDVLAEKARMIANHGQSSLYLHEVVGVNSRLDALQAVVLQAKLPHLDRYNKSRAEVAESYSDRFRLIGDDRLVIPKTTYNSTHVFHQYTLRVRNEKRADFRAYLQSYGVPTMVYYPLPLYRQPAYAAYLTKNEHFPNTETLCNEVVSLPIHSEMKEETLRYITDTVVSYFK
jgi:UDP-2-acetamido-2-deoxy-ribo-hexuluronate aminotransferase